MRKWERLETILGADAFNKHFTSLNLAAWLEEHDGLDRWTARREASAMIQSHLGQQTKPNSVALYILTRTGRTTSAVWHVGARQADAVRNGKQMANDVWRRWERFHEPTLTLITARNPRAARRVNAIMNSMETQIGLLAALLTDDE